MAAISKSDRRAFLSIRLTYFARFGALAFLLPFINLFYRRHDLTGTQIGLLGTIGAISSLVAAPVWGRWSDATRHPRRLIQLGLALSSLAVFLLGQQTVFGWMALFVSINAIVQAGIEPLSDSLAIAVSRGEGYGGIRMWGSIGWAVLVLAGGWLIEHLGQPVIFVGYVTLLVAAALALNLSPFEPNTTHQPGGQNMRQALAGLAKSRAMLGLLFVLIVVWFTMTSLLTFEPVYLHDLGAGETVIGLSFTLAALVEPFAMLWTDRQARIVGAGRLLQLGLLMGIARVGLIIAFPTIPVIVAVRVLEGASYGLRQTAIVLLITRIAPPGQTAVALALFTTTLLNLVQIAGLPLAGAIYDTAGPYWLYVIALVAQIIAWAILQFTLPRRDAAASSEAV